MAERARPSRPRASRRRADPARRAAYDVLRAVADRDAYANLLLPALLTERGLTGRDAAFATELTYGTLRGRGTYDAIVAACSDRDQLDPTVRDVLRLGAHQLLATRVGPHAAVATSVDLAKDVCGPRPSGFVNAVLRRVATRDLDGWTEIVAPSRDLDPYGYLAVRHSYPRWIIEAFADALGQASTAELEDALAAGNLRPDVVLAVTPGRTASQDPASQDPASQDPDVPGTTPTRWSPYGQRLAAGDPTPYVASGQAVVQDEASQLAALALTRVSVGDNASDPGPDRLWLDLCAGPGGKARLLAGLAAERGARLVASDVRPHRARPGPGRPAPRRTRPGRHRRRRAARPLAARDVRPRARRRALLEPRLAAPPPRSPVAQDPGRRARAGRGPARSAGRRDRVGPARRRGRLRDLLTAPRRDPRCGHRRRRPPWRRHHPRRSRRPRRRPRPARLRPPVRPVLAAPPRHRRHLPSSLPPFPSLLKRG